MHMTPQGYERPRARQPLPYEATELINTVCPGIRVSGPDTPVPPRHVQESDVWGPAYGLFLARASDSHTRFICSSGGVLTEITAYLLENDYVDCVLHVAARREQPLRNGIQISRTRDDLLRASGSRYAPAAPLADLNSLLEQGSTIAFVGKPCDVAALANLARRDARVDHCIRFRFAMFCGGVSALGKSLEPLEPHGVTEADVALYRYRGHGNPGPTHVETTDGRFFDFRYVDLWEDGAQRLQFRCTICPDAIGLSADLVVHDVWPEGPPEDDVASVNGVIIRTPRGLDLFNAAVKSGAIEAVGSYAFDDLERYQPHQAERRRAVATRIAAMRDEKTPCPQFEGLGLEKLARQTSSSQRAREYQGMRRRLKRNRHREGL